MFHHHFSMSRLQARLRTRPLYSRFHRHIPLACTPSNEEPEPPSFKVSEVEYIPQGIDCTNPIQVFIFLCLFSIWFGGFSRRKMEMVVRYVSNKIE